MPHRYWDKKTRECPCTEAKNSRITTKFEAFKVLSGPWIKCNLAFEPSIIYMQIMILASDFVKLLKVRAKGKSVA